MKDDNKWPIAHEYMRMVADKAVPAINCPDCDFPMILVSDLDGWPALKCQADAVSFSISLRTYDIMLSNIREAKDL